MGWFSFLFMLIIAGAAQAELHEFNLPDGRSIKAEIVDYNAKLGMVQLRREDGKRLPKVKPTTFVKEDQEYIHNWAKLAGFRSPSLFKITCKDDQIEKWKEEEEGKVRYSDGSVETETISETHFEKFVYNVKLENKNNVPLEGIKFEYRIYYEQGTSKMKKASKKPKSISGELELRRLSPKQKTILKTKPVVIHKKEYFGDFTNMDGSLSEPDEGEILGIWLRAYAKGADGKMIVRDVYQPDSLAGKYAW